MELFRLALASQIVSWVPQPFKYRIANLLYPFKKQQKGVDIIINYLPKKFNGLKFLLNTHDYIGWNIFFLGEYENDTNLVLKEYVKPGMTVIEAGANNGSESVIIAHLLGPTGHLFAFEPFEKVARILNINILINNCDSIITLEKLALGSSEETIEFYIPKENVSNQGEASKYPFSSTFDSIHVKQTKLDQWVKTKNVSRVDFIKMDVQGAEMDILEGARNTIKLMKPVIYLEADAIQSSNGNSNLDTLYRNLIELDYEIYTYIDNKKTKLLYNNIMSGNWLAIPRDE